MRTAGASASISNNPAPSRSIPDPSDLHVGALAPDARGAGHAAAVLWAVLDHVAREGGRVWLNARPAAERLYERAGFVPEGPRWVDPAYGPHLTMRRDDAAA